jgi:hypothetical protein
MPKTMSNVVASRTCAELLSRLDEAISAPIAQPIRKREKAAAATPWCSIGILVEWSSDQFDWKATWATRTARPANTIAVRRSPQMRIVSNMRRLTSKVTGDPGPAEGPPVGVRVDRWVRAHVGTGPMQLFVNAQGGPNQR